MVDFRLANVNVDLHNLNDMAGLPTDITGCLLMRHTDAAPLSAETYSVCTETGLRPHDDCRTRPPQGSALRSCCPPAPAQLF